MEDEDMESQNENVDLEEELRALDVGSIRRDLFQIDPDTLFPKPMTFTFYPSAKCVEKLVKCIKKGRGTVVPYERKDEYPYVITIMNFLAPEIADIQIPNDAFADLFIHDVVRQKDVYAVDLNAYICDGSDYEEYDANEILHQQKSWSDLTRRASSQPLRTMSNIWDQIDREEQGPSHAKTPRKRLEKSSVNEQSNANINTHTDELLHASPRRSGGNEAPKKRTRLSPDHQQSVTGEVAALTSSDQDGLLRSPGSSVQSSSARSPQGFGIQLDSQEYIHDVPKRGKGIQRTFKNKDRTLPEIRPDSWINTRVENRTETHSNSNTASISTSSPSKPQPTGEKPHASTRTIIDKGPLGKAPRHLSKYFTSLSSSEDETDELQQNKTHHRQQVDTSSAATATRTYRPASANTATKQGRLVAPNAARTAAHLTRSFPPPSANPEAARGQSAAPATLNTPLTPARSVAPECALDASSSQDELNISDMESPVRQHNQRNGSDDDVRVFDRTRDSRHEYSKSHGQAILDYILSKKLVKYVGGNQIWKTIEIKKVLERQLGARTFQSIRNHFLKTIVPDLLRSGGPIKYRITNEQLQEYKRIRNESKRTKVNNCPKTLLDKIT